MQSRQAAASTGCGSGRPEGETVETIRATVHTSCARRRERFRPTSGCPLSVSPSGVRHGRMAAWRCPQAASASATAPVTRAYTALWATSMTSSLRGQVEGPPDRNAWMRPVEFCRGCVRWREARYRLGRDRGVQCGLFPAGAVGYTGYMNISGTRDRLLGALHTVLPSAAGPGRLLIALDRLEHTERVDRLIDVLRAGVRAVPMGRGRDVLHGRWLGHPAHPLMVQLPLGSWMSAAALDFVPGRQRAARTLVGIGLVAALPAAAAGWADWAELRRPQMRVGLVHAVSNAAGVALYGVSLAARARGRFARGRLWGLGGLAAVSVGGALGGHMAFRQASGANHAEHVPELVGTGWWPVGDLADFPVGTPLRSRLNDEPVVVVHESYGSVRVLSDRCSHMGGPLSEGEVVDGCIRCPWHGSTFRLSDGWNTSGPATAAQPAFETRITGALVEARLQHLGKDAASAAAGEEDGR